MPIFADDYVTEKFFSRMSNTVTVVMGGADYEKLASPHSYVNVLDYPPPPRTRIISTRTGSGQGKVSFLLLVVRLLPRPTKRR
jgi:hypothetical protein